MSSHTTYDLSGVVSVVTGGGRDVSKATAPALAADWATQTSCVYAAGPGWMTTEPIGPVCAVSTTRENTWAPSPRIGGEADLRLGAVLFLSSKASDFITGQSIYVDGGYLAT